VVKLGCYTRDLCVHDKKLKVLRIKYFKWLDHILKHTNYEQYTRPASKHWPDQIMDDDMTESASKAPLVHWKGKAFMDHPQLPPVSTSLQT
jgi:hypothetical protein